MIPWNRHGIDWTDPDKDTRRCDNGPFYFALFLLAAIGMAAIGGWIIA